MDKKLIQQAAGKIKSARRLISFTGTLGIWLDLRWFYALFVSSQKVRAISEKSPSIPLCKGGGNRNARTLIENLLFFGKPNLFN